MKTEELVNHLMMFLNNFDGMQREKFLEATRKMHPTIQQIFAGHVLAWINDYATNYRVDDRNRCSVEECKKILNAYRVDTGGEKLRERFPMI